MLALVLYTSRDCNYAMCAAERDGDYDTWWRLSRCLEEAIDGAVATITASDG